MSPNGPHARQVLDEVASLRRHRQDDRGSPHEPLSFPLAPGRLAAEQRGPARAG